MPYICLVLICEENEKETTKKKIQPVNTVIKVETDTNLVQVKISIIYQYIGMKLVKTMTGWKKRRGDHCMI